MNLNMSPNKTTMMFVIYKFNLIPTEPMDLAFCLKATIQIMFYPTIVMKLLLYAINKLLN